MAEGIAGWDEQEEPNGIVLMDLLSLHTKLRQLATIADKYKPDYYDWPGSADHIILRGYSEATLTLSVYKTAIPHKFAIDQAMFMEFLGDKVCPKILVMNNTGYCMEYLQPARSSANNIRMIEATLRSFVWNRVSSMIPTSPWRIHLRETLTMDIPDWALSERFLIHGDPTIDNCLIAMDGSLRITDPIPPPWLKRPSILYVDYGKMLQSLLGWEVVLRGSNPIEYAWPDFMLKPESARGAVFWCMVALRRICLRSKDDDKPGQWAAHIAKELETICMLSS